MSGKSADTKLGCLVRPLHAIKGGVLGNTN